MTLRVEELMRAKSVEAQSLPVKCGVIVWRGRVPVQVSSSSFDRGAKLCSPSPKTHVLLYGVTLNIILTRSTLFIPWYYIWTTGSNFLTELSIYLPHGESVFPPGDFQDAVSSSDSPPLRVLRALTPHRSMGFLGVHSWLSNMSILAFFLFSDPI
ncbi:hypothetical protein TNCV_154311 [Trichonephila clavipes]|uniref:Uncharacterized protein n=1 Tax=Trichonephila clavipes TaxID=2585209 RepID=A0A8X6WH21_TRICX|nr:hypothetical protein TNCV_154311 [Trichonephila clavipes]